MLTEPVVLAMGALLVGLLVSVVAAARYRREARELRGLIDEQAQAPAASDVVPISVKDLQQTADAMGIALVRIDRRGRVLSANDTAHRFLGWQPPALVGKTTMEAFVDHRIEDLVRRTRAGSPGQVELASSGEPQLTLIVRARPVAGNGGTWVVLEDVSELRRLQRIRAEFIDNLSHELRTPLATVRLLVESLTLDQERAKLPPRIRDSIIQIDVETGQLAQMVNELLDLAKIEAGEAPLELGQVDLGEVIEQTLDRLRLYAERQGVSLHDELPADSSSRTIEADVQRIGQLLINLVHNAVKFSPDGGDVTVRLRAAADEIVIEVADRGRGIPREELERIFERFYKVDRARLREGGGTGLGLAIARHITERHGGQIWAESEEGKGSRFFVRLPRQPN